MIAYRTKTQKVIEPLPHQQRILEELKIFNKALVHIPSGAGKTHTAAFDVRNKKPSTFLYISHRNEINTQAIKIFKEVCGIEDQHIGQINQTSKQFDKPFLFATIQTISRKKHMKKLRKDIDYVVIDEFHHAAAKTYRKIMKHLQPKILLGLTATPDRMDAQDVRQLLDNNVVGNIDIMEGIKNKILTPFHYLAFWDNVDYNTIEWNGHNYKENDLDKVLLIPERDKKIIEKYNEIIKVDNRQTIAFCATIKHVKKMVEKFKELGIKAEGITHKDQLSKRKKIIEMFRNGEINVLFSRDILNEGIDFPECEALMFLRPTMSETIFLQQLGRGLRKKRGKKPIVVLDFIGNYHNAFKIKSYLSKIVNTKIKIIQKGRNYKPEYNLSVPIYEFESEILEMMELQEIMSRKHRDNYGYNYTKKELIQNYYNTKKLLNGAIPTVVQICDPKISPISVNPYLIRYGTWNNFLKSIGEPVNKLYTRAINTLDEIKKIYLKAKKEMGLKKGEFISQTVFEKKYGTRVRYSLYRLGITSWLSFLSTIGEDNTVECSNCKRRIQRISKRNTKYHFCCSSCYSHWKVENKEIYDKYRQNLGKFTAVCSHCNKTFKTMRNINNNNKSRIHRFCSRRCADLLYWELRKRKKEKNNNIITTINGN